ncbi:MAG TPA: thymidylate synthase [Deltaproteobacteria bacterium]|nr:thymidylate synthase [Deltaproteobacteria bacterium]
MKIHRVDARDLPDLWFQAVHDILDHGSRFTINRGSYSGQTRLEYDYFMGHVKHPGTKPLIPDIPSSCGIPNPVEEAYLYGGDGYERSYIEYLMSSHKEPGESYTYGERLTKTPIAGDKLTWWNENNQEIVDKRDVDGKVLFEENNTLYLNQIEWIIDTYKKYGERNNQMVLQVAHPSDLTLLDPPCLRSIDTRIQDGKLHFTSVLFRSWDLWGGMPANLAAIQNLKEYMSAEIGVEDGEMIVESKGLHLYGYAEDLAKLRCMKA